MKNFFSKFFILVIFLLQVIVPFGNFALAQNGNYSLDSFAQSAGYATGTSEMLEPKVTKVLNVFLSLVGLIFLGMAIYAGMRWLTAQGNEDKVTEAKDVLEAAIIGMVVVSISYAITNKIFSLLAGS